MTTQSDNEQVTVFADLAELTAAKGAELGPTDWLTVDQARVDQFAEATDDHQWIHVDPERAASGPYGGTIAHGLLTLSLLPHFMHRPLPRRWRRHGNQLRLQQGSLHHAGAGRVATARPLDTHHRDRGRRRTAGDTDDDHRSRRVGQAGGGRRIHRQVRGLTWPSRPAVTPLRRPRLCTRPWRLAIERRSTPC